MIIETSRQAVFQTTELLENILVHLPMRDILVTQRVCQKFDAVIKGSVSIQQKLFSRPYEKGELWQFTKYPDDPLRTGEFSIAKGEVPKEERLTLAKLNPLFTVCPIASGDSVESRRIMLASQDGYGVAMKEFLTATLDRLLVQNFAGCGTWRNMFITDPPSKELQLAILWTSGGLPCSDHMQEVSYKRDEGITIGYLVEQYLAHRIVIHEDGRVYDAEAYDRQDDGGEWTPPRHTRMSMGDYLAKMADGSVTRMILSRGTLVLRDTLCAPEGKDPYAAFGVAQ